MMDWSPADRRWKLQFCFGPAKCSSPCLNHCKLILAHKGRLPRPAPLHRPPDSPLKASFFLMFQCGQEPAGFIGVLKNYSLKHSSSVSTRSRQFPFFSPPHSIFISRSLLSPCSIDSLFLSKTSFPFPSFSVFSRNPSSYPQSSLQWFSLASSKPLSYRQSRQPTQHSAILHSPRFFVRSETEVPRVPGAGSHPLTFNLGFTKWITFCCLTCVNKSPVTGEAGFYVLPVPYYYSAGTASRCKVVVSGSLRHSN